MAVSVLVWALLGPPMMWLLHRAITGGHVPTEPLRTGRARRERLVAPAMRAGVLPPDPEPDVWRRALTAEVREWNGQRWVAGVFAGVGAGLIGAAAVVANDNAPVCGWWRPWWPPKGAAVYRWSDRGLRTARRLLEELAGR